MNMQGMYFPMDAYPYVNSGPHYPAPIPIKSKIFVPNAAVGFLIGAKGSNIKSMARVTGASIRMDGTNRNHKAQITGPLNDSVHVSIRDDVGRSPKLDVLEIPDNRSSPSSSKGSKKVKSGTQPTSPLSPSNSNQQPKSVKKSPWKNGHKSDGRFVAISGYDFQVYKAQSWVFQAIAEMKNASLEELVLTAETMVPSLIVGRIIGREGRNIKELRRLVQAIIYIVETPSYQTNSPLAMTPVRITGNVFCLQAAQMHFATVIREVEQVEPCRPFYLNPTLTDFYYPSINALMHPYPSNTSLPMRSARLKSQIFVPESVIGVLIGVKGSNIKNMVFATGASIRIDGAKKSQNVRSDAGPESSENLRSQSLSKLAVKDDVGKSPKLDLLEILDNRSSPTSSKVSKKVKSEAQPSSPLSPSKSNQQQKNAKKSSWEDGHKSDGRFVAISGYDFQVYKAQSWVFQAVSETENVSLEELVLTAETMVPSLIVGRIIGREGRNIKELRRLVQAIIYIVETPSYQTNSPLAMTPVRITGNLFCLQAVQMHFATLLAEVEAMEIYKNKRPRSTTAINVFNN